MSRIFVIGSSNTDMVVKTAQLPKPGQTVLGGDFFMNPGGKGANQAVAAARLGGKVSLVANLGTDIFGDEALAHFRQEHIDCTYISRDSQRPSGVALISVDDQAENHIVVAPGANGGLSVDLADKALAEVHAGDVVLLQLEIPIQTVEHVIKVASEKGAKVVLNPAPVAILSPELLSGLYLLTPNETEASMLTGVEVTDEASAFQAAKKLMAQGVEHVMVTLGSKGALVVTKESKELIAAPAVKAVDTTAAGDCFNGAVAVWLANGLGLSAAAEMACRAASISVTRLGAQASLPFLQEVGA